MRLLAIESSCDETAAAVVEDGRHVLSSVIHSQVEEHRQYGGVVPEIASRRHTEQIIAVTQKALDNAQLALEQIDGIAVTYAPGLIGAVLVGVNFAKGLSLATGKPLIPVHHLRGHIAANYIAHPQLEPPFLCLVVSGGHSHLIEVLGYTTFRIIGRTRDDAAGEAFDKAARAMGFPYPGGVYLDRAAQAGNPAAYRLPLPRVEGSPYDFSFSGLKTAFFGGGGTVRLSKAGDRRRGIRQLRVAGENGGSVPPAGIFFVRPPAPVVRGQRRHDRGAGVL